MQLDAVSFEVPGRVLLDAVTFTFAATGVTGLIGQNGSGKSTLLKILARQQAASSGRVTLAGEPLHSWSEREFARKVAYLPQHTPPAAGLEVRELVALGRYPWHGAFGRFGDVDRDKVAEAMQLTATADLADRLVDTLSGGERQRAWLAMLLAQDARLLLLDEPISALDAAHQVSVLRLIRTISRNRGIGVVVVIHDVNLAARFCDRLVALKHGRLAAHGEPAELMTSERLEAVFDVPMGVVAHPDSGQALAYVRE